MITLEFANIEDAEKFVNQFSETALKQIMRLKPATHFEKSTIIGFYRSGATISTIALIALRSEFEVTKIIEDYIFGVDR